jgi:general L-amino acid transport system permease protein
MTLVILPQALRTMIPSITNQYLNLSKNSSLAVVIGYSELFLISSTIINNAGHAVPMFTLIIATYLTLNLIIAGAMSWLNRRVQLARI